MFFDQIFNQLYGKTILPHFNAYTIDLNLHSDVIVDTKGRILIPKDIREKLNILPGVRFLIKIEDGRLVLLKTTTLEDFQSVIDTFQEKLKKLTSDPIPTEKLF